MGSIYDSFSNPTSAGFGPVVPPSGLYGTNLPSGPINSPFGNPVWNANGLYGSGTVNGGSPVPEKTYEQLYREKYGAFTTPPADPFNGVRGGGASGPGVPTDPRTANMTPPAGPQAPNQGVGGGLQNTFATLNSPAFAEQVKAAQNKANGQPGTGTGTNNPLAPNAQQQNWLKENSGLWGNFAQQFINGQGQNGQLDPMNIDWTNFSNGKPEHITRALGVVNQQGGDALAKMLGGQLVDNPMATFGTNQRDKFIKMPNGQMIDASVLQNQLNGVKDFSGLTNVLNTYKNEANAYNPATSMDIQAIIQRGEISPTTPQGWNPSTFAGGNPTYAPQGAAQGNPGNPGMGTSNPVEFQGNQINAINGQNGFPMFNYSQSNPGLNGGGLYSPQGSQGTPQNPIANLPQGNYNVPQPPASTTNTGATGPSQGANLPQGQNSNWQYYLSGGGSGGGAGSTGGGGAVTNNAAGMGSLRGGRRGGDMQQPKTTNSWTGSLPNGAGSVGK